MKVYLDNCCFNRPFDDQSQLRILLETEAKLRIQELIRQGELALCWSYVLDYENSKNPFRERREQIRKWRGLAEIDIVQNDAVLETARSVVACGVKKLDALHIACAMQAGAECFLTTDDGIVKKAKSLQSIRVLDPIGFIKEVKS